jgi:hypothetical protein
MQKDCVPFYLQNREAAMGENAISDGGAAEKDPGAGGGIFQLTWT